MALTAVGANQEQSDQESSNQESSNQEGGRRWL